MKNRIEWPKSYDKYNLRALSVLDDGDRLIGIITVDDIVALLRQG